MTNIEFRNNKTPRDKRAPFWVNLTCAIGIWVGLQGPIEASSIQAVDSRTPSSDVTLIQKPIPEQEVTVAENDFSYPDPTIVFKEYTQSDSILYHLENDKLPGHEDQQVTYTAELRAYEQGNAPDILNYYISDEGEITPLTIQSLQLTADGRPFSKDNKDQFGIMIYFAKEHIPPDVSEDEYVLSLSKYLFPKSLESIVETSGYTLRSKYLEDDAYRNVTWIISGKGKPTAVAYAPNNIEAMGLPSSIGYLVQAPQEGNDFWYVTKTTPHECFHGSAGFVGSSNSQEALAQLAQAAYLARMVKEEYIPHDEYTKLFDTAPYLRSYTGNPAIGSETGEVVPAIAYNTNYAAYLLFQHADFLGIDDTDAFDDAGYPKPDTLIAIWQKFQEGNYYLMHFMPPSEFEEIMRSITGVPDNSVLIAPPSIKGDWSIMAGFLGSKMLNEGSAEWQKVADAIQQMQEKQSGPFGEEMNDFFFESFIPENAPLSGPASNELTGQLVYDTWARGKGYTNYYIPMQEVAMGFLSIILGKTTPDNDVPYFFNVGYEHGWIGSMNTSEKQLVVEPGKDIEKVGVLVRNASGSFLGIITGESGPTVLPTGELLYFVIVDNDGFKEPTAVNPITISELEMVPDSSQIFCPVIMNQ